MVVSIAMLLCVSEPALADATCDSGVQLTGEAAIVASVQASLSEELPFDATSEEHCAPISAHLEAWEGGVLLSLVIPGHERLHRTATNAKEAAIVIQSWARHSFTEPLLRPRGSEKPRATTVASVDTEEPALVQEQEAVVSKEGIRDIHLGVSGTMGFGSDRSLWSGARFQGCVDIRGICFGGIAEYAEDLEFSGSAFSAGSTRQSLSLLFSVEVPTKVLDVRVSPGVALGQGTVSARTGMSGDTIEDDTMVLVTRGFFKAVAPLGSSWSAVGEAAIDYTPLGQRRLALDESVDAPLAGSVRGSLWMSLGLRYEGL
jgi:hypothetical protein